MWFSTVKHTFAQMCDLQNIRQNILLLLPEKHLFENVELC